VKLWIVMERWPGAKKWRPVHVETDQTAAAAWMDGRYRGTVWERRVQPATLER
jgi:hypothetical protein